MLRSFSQGHGAVIIQHTFHTSLLQPTQPYAQHCSHAGSHQQQQNCLDAASTMSSALRLSGSDCRLQHTLGNSVISSTLNILKWCVKTIQNLSGPDCRWKEEGVTHMKAALCNWCSTPKDRSAFFPWCPAQLQSSTHSRTELLQWDRKSVRPFGEF